FSGSSDRVMLRRLAIAPLLTVLLLSGCAPKPSIVGTWKVTVSGAQDVSATFAEGGAFTLNATVQSMKGSANGSYTLANDLLTITFSKINLPTDIPDALKSLAEAEAKKQLSLGASTIVWVSNDEIRVTPPVGGAGIFAKPFTMTRNK
ncbi:MAG: hypothetical protein ABL962_15005, partial [Fimbriimonadaceae bacterium]